MPLIMQKKRNNKLGKPMNKDSREKLNSHFTQAANSLTSLFKVSILIQDDCYKQGQVDAYKEIIDFCLKFNNGDITKVPTHEMISFLKQKIQENGKPGGASNLFPAQKPAGENVLAGGLKSCQGPLYPGGRLNAPAGEFQEMKPATGENIILENTAQSYKEPMQNAYNRFSEMGAKKQGLMFGYNENAIQKDFPAQPVNNLFYGSGFQPRKY